MSDDDMFNEMKRDLCLRKEKRIKSVIDELVVMNANFAISPIHIEFRITPS